MTCRGQTHVLALRQPMQAAALEVNLKEAATRHTVKIESPPDPSKIRVEIKNVLGIQHTIEPHAVLMAEKGEAWIKLQDGGGLLALRAETDMRRDLQMVLTPYVQWTSDARPERLVVRQLAQTKAKLLAAVNHWGVHGSEVAGLHEIQGIGRREEASGPSSPELRERIDDQPGQPDQVPERSSRCWRKARRRSNSASSTMRTEVR
jgi:hypothetical protein